MDRDLFERLLKKIEYIYKKKWIKGGLYQIRTQYKPPLPWAERNREFTVGEKYVLNDFIYHATVGEERLIEHIGYTYKFYYSDFRKMKRALETNYVRLYS